jgi:hypothetical protein
MDASAIAAGKFIAQLAMSKCMCQPSIWRIDRVEKAAGNL